MNSVCVKCGTTLLEGQAFCPMCGQRVEANVDDGRPEVQVDQPAVVENKKKNRLVPILIVSIAVTMAAMAFGVLLLINIFGQSGPDFEDLYDQYCESEWAEVGEDGSYLSIDTNPDDVDMDDVDDIDYLQECIDAFDTIESINSAMGLPDSLYKTMGETTSLDGRQEENFPDQGVTVSWKYHPDNGLEVIYTEY